ncbi:MAG: ABC transporter permease [Eubacteriales bacterium]|nr:ABC transporter permease [Eubacteriales bacterium]
MKKITSRFYLALIFLFLYAPIAVLIVNSFNASKSRTVWTGFTLDWYRKLLTNETIINSLGNTLLVAAVASTVATLIGTAAAIGIYNMKKIPRSIVLNITYLPILNPEIVTGVSLMLLFVAVKMEFGFTTLILSHITFCVPYVILNVLPKLRQMNRNLYDAAMDLGCNPTSAFFKAVLPEIMPGIVTGFLMALTYSIDDFIISYFTYGATSQTLSITIFSMTRRKVSPEVNALSAIIFAVVLAILLVMNLRDAKLRKNTRRVSGERI